MKQTKYLCAKQNIFAHNDFLHNFENLNKKKNNTGHNFLGCA